MANIILDTLFYIVVYASIFISVFWFTTFLTSENKVVARKREYPALSIIIPAYNEAKSIPSCIKSLVMQKYPKLKLIVVNDGSTDNTGTVVKGLMKKYRNMVYVEKRNGGKASALNTGLKYVNTELFGFIDADTLLSANALKSMVNYIDGRAVAVIAAIKPHKPKNFMERLQKIEYLIASFTRRLMAFLDSLYFTPGFALYKTSVIKQLGGFDEKNITEDLEIGLRLKNHGYIIENSTDDYAYTAVPKDIKSLFRQRIRWYRGSIYNTRKYSHVLFNKKFGDLGIFVLPAQYMLLAVVIPFLLLSIFDGIKYIAQRVIDIFITNFDINYLLSTFQINIITPTTIFLLISLASFLLMVSISQKNIRERVNKIDYVMYIMVYPFLHLFLWMVALTYEALKIRRKW